MAIVEYTQHRYNGSSWDDLYPKTQASQVEHLIDTIYPVGSIYLSADSTSPATHFGGTWQAIGQGRVLMGVGTGTDIKSNTMTITAGATGGEYKHTLTTEEMPSHSHTSNSVLCEGASTGWWTMRGVNRTESASQGTEVTNETGGGQSHNNVQPYLGVYMWQRTG